jgi:hypothetical protein
LSRLERKDLVKVSSDMSLSRQGFESIEVMGGWFGIKAFTGTGWRVGGLVGGKLGFAIEVREVVTSELET